MGRPRRRIKSRVCFGYVRVWIILGYVHDPEGPDWNREDIADTRIDSSGSEKEAMLVDLFSGYPSLHRRRLNPYISDVAYRHRNAGLLFRDLPHRQVFVLFPEDGVHNYNNHRLILWLVQ